MLVVCGKSDNERIFGRQMNESFAHQMKMKSHQNCKSKVQSEMKGKF